MGNVGAFGSLTQQKSWLIGLRVKGVEMKVELVYIQKTRVGTTWPLLNWAEAGGKEEGRDKFMPLVTCQSVREYLRKGYLL